MGIVDTLPIAGVLDQLRQSLQLKNRLILQAPPGAGKTTAVPLALLDEPWLAGRRIIMLQPRRIAARNAASRIAELLNETVGERVGYHIRGERRLSQHTRILIVTEGILTRYLQNDPALETAAMVIFDEFHERNLHSDVSMAFALQSQEILREDLKILVMSATLDTRGLSELLEYPDIITSEGRCFDIETFYLPVGTSVPDVRASMREAHRQVLQSLLEDDGDILVFLPGEREIRDLETTLRRVVPTDITIACLYGSLSREEQNRAIQPGPFRKIVLSTNIAETSLTIEGIRIVIDTGFERISRFDPSTGMERLHTQRISKASADQRCGRSGRTSDGKCYRLWNRHTHSGLAAYRESDILIADLTPLALELAAWGSEDLRWIDPPKPSSLQQARTLLEEIGAIEGDNATAYGNRLLTSGLHPRLSHMLMCAEKLDCSGEALVLAVLLSERDILPQGESNSSMDARFCLLVEALQTSRPSPALTGIVSVFRDLAERVQKKVSYGKLSSVNLGVLLSFAYPDRICRSRGNGKYISSNGKEYALDPNDPLTRFEWIVTAHSDGDATCSKIRICEPLDIDQIRRHHPKLFSARECIEWNSTQKRVEARANEYFGSILLSTVPIASPDMTAIHGELLKGIRMHGLESVGWEESFEDLRHRLEALHVHRSDLFPESFDSEALLDRLEKWLLPHLDEERSLEECRKLDIKTILLSSLPWDIRREADSLLPEFYTAPTGTRIRIDYREPHAPVLEVRIQEMFGLAAHPCVLNGTLPLIIHLLSPARRPIQLTRDLVGFWNGSYADVKKELKGRYPKHFWPDEPSRATATVKTKKQMGQ